MEVNLICQICMDIYDDPVFARDGYTYCRLCIGRWIGVRQMSWKSPRTNLEIHGTPSIVSSNGEYRTMVLEKKRQLVKEAVSAKNLGGALAIHERGMPVLEAPRLAELRALPPGEHASAVDALNYLEAAHRAGVRAELPSHSFRELALFERYDLAMPFLTLSCWEAFYREALDSKQKDLAWVLLEHLKWRTSVVDAVSLDRQCLDAHDLVDDYLLGVYYRTPDGAGYGRGPVFRNPETEVELRLPTEYDTHPGIDDQEPLALFVRTGKHAFSEEPIPVFCRTRLVRSEADRKRRVLPFPDSDPDEHRYFEGQGHPCHSYQIFEQTPVTVPDGAVYVPAARELPSFYLQARRGRYEITYYRTTFDTNSRKRRCE